jgi:hypothetical protein
MTDSKKKQPFYLIDTSAEFYRPLGVRLAICISVACWAAIEAWNGDGFWGVISLAAAVYCVYVLFLTYNPPPKQEPVVRPPDTDDDDDVTPPPATAAGEERPDTEGAETSAGVGPRSDRAD